MRLADTPRFQLIPAVYESEAEAVDRVLELEDKVDGFLFTGPVPYYLVQARIATRKTMSFVPLSGASLFAAVTRCVLDGAGDPLHISIDCMRPSDVVEAYDDLALGDTAGVVVAPRHLDEDVAALVDFHLAAQKYGASLALTGVRSVYERLIRANVSAVRVVPVSASIRSALRTAVLRTAGEQVEKSQAWVAVFSGSPHDPMAALAGEVVDEWMQKLTRIRKWVRTRDGMVFTTSTIGAAAIWVQRSGSDVPVGIAEELQAVAGDGVRLRVGSGDSVLQAYARAAGLQADVAEATSPGEPVDARDEGRSAEHIPASYRELLRAMGGGSNPTTSEPGFISADTAAELLGLSDRQARRLLDSFVDAGLAWPLPPQRHGGPGRPRRSWRLALDPGSDDVSSPVR